MVWCIQEIAPTAGVYRMGPAGYAREQVPAACRGTKQEIAGFPNRSGGYLGVFHGHHNGDRYFDYRVGNGHLSGLKSVRVFLREWTSGRSGVGRSMRRAKPEELNWSLLPLPGPVVKNKETSIP